MLAERIARGTIPLTEALAIASKIAVALEAAHEQRIIHRDLKPPNVKLTPDDDVKVLDFGLAKIFVDDQPDADSSLSPTITHRRPRLRRTGEKRDARRRGPRHGGLHESRASQGKESRQTNRHLCLRRGALRNAHGQEDVSR